MNQLEDNLLQVAPASVLAGIPQHLIDVPQRIADATGVHVQLLPMCKEELAHASGLEKSPLVLDISAEKHAITIWYGTVQFNSAMIAHELIHLRRDVIESIPKLMPGSSASPSVTGEVFLLENDLEHLVVIPEEIRAFAESEQFWVDHYKQTIQSAYERGDQFALAMHWAQIRNSLPNQIDLAKALAAHLRSYGEDFVYYADTLREEFRVGLSSKGALHDIIARRRPTLHHEMGTGRFTIENGFLEFQPLSFAGMLLTNEDHVDG